MPSVTSGHSIAARSTTIWSRACTNACTARDHEGSVAGNQRFFDEVIKRSVTDGSGGGCMLVNSALEVAPHDPEFRKIVGGTAYIEAFFAAHRDRTKAGTVTSRQSAEIGQLLPQCSARDPGAGADWARRSILEAAAKTAQRSIEALAGK